MKKRAFVLLVLASVLAFNSCNHIEKDLTKKPEKNETKIQIGMSFDSFVIERWTRDKDVFVSTARELGAEVNVQNANGDLQKQRDQIEYFVNKGMDAIVVICIDSNGLSEAVAKAKAAGIKVIAYDRQINNSDVDLYITFDNEKVGRLMGEAMVAGGIGSGSKVIMLGGSPTDSNVPLVENGFKSVMDANGVQVIDQMHAESWRAELAADYIYNNEDKVAEANAIMCGNDNLAGQAIHALAEKRLAGNLLVTGQDAELEACQRIVEGTQLMTVYKPVEKLAKRAAECAISLVKNEKLSGEDVSSVSDGTYDVSYIGMEPIPVTESNIDEVIISSGFHLKEDVYLNVPEKLK